MKSPSPQVVPRTRGLLGLLAVAVALSLVAGCSRDESSPSAPKRSALSTQLAPALHTVAVNAGAIERARQVKVRYWARLKHEPGVFGMGISWNENGAVFIRVTVDKDHVAGIAKIQQEVEGIPVRIQVSDPPTSFAKPPPPPPLPPIYMGTSTGNTQPDYCGQGGTVGCVVAAGRNRYFLSCAHVFAPADLADEGTTVSDPMRRLPACNPQPIIGTVFDLTSMNCGGSYTMDAAIATVAKGLNYTTAMYTGYTPTSTVTPESVGLAVKKTGTATGLRSGTVTVIHYDISLAGATCGHEFTDQMVVEPAGFAVGGDSGALVVTETGNSPVGIVIGGGSSFTVVTPIQRILDRFGVTVAP